jgi:uncharacterized protein YbjT (DUF2867 family)
MYTRGHGLLLVVSVELCQDAAIERSRFLVDRVLLSSGLDHIVGRDL